MVIGDTKFASATASTSSTAQTSIATLTAADFNTAKLVISAKDTTTNEIHSCEMLVIHNGTNAYATEYAVVYSGSDELATYDVTLSGASVYIQATPASSNATDFVVTQVLNLTA